MVQSARNSDEAVWREEIRGAEKWVHARLPTIGPPELERLVERAMNLVRHQNKPWDVLRVEYWSEGRFLLYPAELTTRDRIDNVGIELIVRNIKEKEKVLDTLPDQQANSEELALMRANLRLLVPALSAALDVPVRGYYADSDSAELSSDASNGD